MEGDSKYSPYIPPPVYSIDQRHQLLNVRDLIVGVEWDLIDTHNPVDLDLSAVCFNRSGEYVDAIYFSNLTNSNNSILHTGDNKTGAGSGHDEEILVNLSTIPTQVFALFFTVTSFNGQTFDMVTSARINLINQTTRTPVLSFPLAHTAGAHTALITCKLYRESAANAGSGWAFHAIGASASATHFGHLIPSLQEHLRDIIPSVRISPIPTTIVMMKGESVVLSKDDSQMSLDRITVGLGWDMIGTQAVDLDVSAVCFNRSHTVTEAIYFNKLYNSNHSIQHEGDNRTGAGDGDDERIFVSLRTIPSDVTDIYLIVNSYTAHKFSCLKNAYVRVVEGGAYGKKMKEGRELIRFQLNGAGSSNDTAVLMARLYRSDSSSGWRMKAIGHGCNGRTYTENIGDMTRELAGRLQSAGGFTYVPARQMKPQQKSGCIIL